MLKNKDFWVGVAIGILVFWFYTNHLSKGGTSKGGGM